MTASLTTLPIELVYDIIELLDRQSLLHCALTCRLLTKIIAPTLWRVIPRLTPAKTIQLIQAIAGSPNAGTQVHEISLNRTCPYRPTPPAPPSRPPTFHEIIARSLGGLFQSQSQSPETQGPTLPVCTVGDPELSFTTFSTAFQKMTQLRKLVIYGHIPSRLWGFTLFIPTLREIFVYREAGSIELLNWIKWQSNLTALRLWDLQWWPDEGSFSFNRRIILFPHLRSLSTTPRGATIFLQCSSVSDLIIENIVLEARSISRELTGAILASKGNLKRLTLVGDEDDVLNLLAQLQGRLHHLNSLRIVFSNHIHGTSRIAPSVSESPTHSYPCLTPTPPTQVYTRNVGSFLRTTRALERFELWIGWHSPLFPDPEIRVPQDQVVLRTEEILVREWARICPQLKVVRFPTNTKWLVDRFERGVPGPRLEYPSWSPTP